MAAALCVQGELAMGKVRVLGGWLSIAAQFGLAVTSTPVQAQPNFALGALNQAPSGPPQILATEKGDLCGSDRALISPSGNHVLFTRDVGLSPAFAFGINTASVYDLPCLFADNAPGGCIRRVFPSSNVSWTANDGVLAWGSDGQFGRGMFLSAEPWSGAFLPNRSLGEVLERSGGRLPTINIQGAPTSRQIMRVLAWAASNSSQEIDAITLSPKAAALVGAPKGTWRAGYRVNGEAAAHDMAIPRNRLSRYVLNQVGDGFTFSGLTGELPVKPIGTANPSASAGPKAYVLDSPSGRVLGVSSPTGAFEMPKAQKLQRILESVAAKDLPVDGGALLREIGVNTSARVAILSYAINLRLRAFTLVRWDARGRVTQSRRIVCAKPANQAGAPVVGVFNEDVKTTFLSLGTPEWPIPSVLLKGTAPSRRLVVYLHGGPVSPTFSMGYFTRWAGYRDLGFDVLAPAVSGSLDLGPEGVRRLRNGPAAALDRDAELLSRDLTRLVSGRYDELVIHAESFSAGLGVELSRRFPDAKLVLLSPWLGYKDPSLWLKAPGPQVAQEEIVLGFGDKDRKATMLAWLDQKIPVERRPEKTLIVIGGEDRRIEVDRLNALADQGRANVVVLKGRDHAFSMIMPETWAAIGQFVD